MKSHTNNARIVVCLFAIAQATAYAVLPVITSQPTSTTAGISSNILFSVNANNATEFQWRFNGSDIPGAVASAFTVTNAQTSNAGYYVVIAKNAEGWVPSQMAYLAVTNGIPGVVPLTNSSANPVYDPAMGTGGLVASGSAQVVAGPALDQMVPVGDPVTVKNGLFPYPSSPARGRLVASVIPGQQVYYRVDISYTNQSGVPTSTRSGTLILTVGGSGISTPSTASLKFGQWIEWPADPIFFGGSPTSQTRVPGETFCISNNYMGYNDFGIPQIQWRKDGQTVTDLIPFDSPYNGMYDTYYRTLGITNLQASDAGVYDALILGNNWLVAQPITISVCLTNGQGLICQPRLVTTNLVYDLVGVAGRRYETQWSSNLVNWYSLGTATNLSGTVTVSNAAGPGPVRFYRTRLVP